MTCTRLFSCEGRVHSPDCPKADPRRGAAPYSALSLRLSRAEGYLDECVEQLQNVDVATMRSLLRTGERPA